MATPFRIVQVVPTLDVAYGGPSRNAFELYKEFNSRPSERSARIVIMRRSRGVTVVDDEHYLRRVYSRLPGLVAVLAIFRSTDIVVFHGLYFWWTIPFSWLCRFFSVPYVITPHGSLSARQRKYSVRKKKIFYTLGGARALRCARVIVVGSEAERIDVAGAFPKLSVRVGGVGVTIPETEPESWGVSQPLSLLSMCRLHRKKRIDVCIRAVALLHRAGIEVVYRIAGVGDDTLRRKLVALAEEEGVAHLVHFVGQKTGADKASLFVSADIFLVPSVEENFGIALAEALSFGLPAIATRAVAAARAMDSSCGRVIAEPDARLIATAVRELSSEPEYGALRQRAYSLACRHFAWAPVADNWMTLLGAATRDRQTRASLR